MFYISQPVLQLGHTQVTHSSQWIITKGQRQLRAVVPPLAFSSPPQVALEAM